MARSPEFWEAVQLDYEIEGLSFDKLHKKHGIAKSAIQTRAKKESWIKEKTGQLIDKKIKVTKDLIEIQAKTGQLKQAEANKVEKIVDKRLQLEEIHLDWDIAVAEKGLTVANNIDATSEDAPQKMQQISAALASTKKVQPQTVINNQNQQTNNVFNDIANSANGTLYDAVNT